MINRDSIRNKIDPTNYLGLYFLLANLVLTDVSKLCGDHSLAGRYGCTTLLFCGLEVLEEACLPVDSGSVRLGAGPEVV